MCGGRGKENERLEVQNENEENSEARLFGLQRQ